MQLLLVDAMNLIRRVYAAVAERAASLEATASRSLTIVGTAAEQLGCTHVVVVFERQQQTWRHEIWPDYKKGRPPMPEELAKGLAGLRHQLELAGLCCIEITPWEADDVIASLADKAVFNSVPVVILSTDKGFCQMVNPRLRLCNHFDRVVLDQAAVEARYGLHIHQLVDFWGMTGDTTNHLPGVAGIGPKAASALLDQYGTLDRCLLSLDQLPERQGKALREQWQQALLTRELVKLRTDVPLGINLHELRWQPQSSRRNSPVV